MKAISLRNFAIGLTLFLPSCVAINLASNATETFIKTQVEQHGEAEFSSIRTFSIFNGPTLNGRALELTGYKYRDQKNLVFAACDGGVMAVKGKQAPSPGKIVFIQISSAQAQGLLDNYKTISERIRSERPGNFETVYHDYSVSPDLFISYSRVQGTFDKQASMHLHLWIKGLKYTLATEQLIPKIEAFVKY